MGVPYSGLSLSHWGITNGRLGTEPIHRGTREIWHYPHWIKHTQPLASKFCLLLLAIDVAPGLGIWHPLLASTRYCTRVLHTHTLSKHTRLRFCECSQVSACPLLWPFKFCPKASWVPSSPVRGAKGMSVCTGSDSELPGCCHLSRALTPQRTEGPCG